MTAVNAGPEARRARPGPLAAVTVWRLILAAVAWWGLYLGLTRGDQWRVVNLHYWSQFSTLTVALAATGSLLSPLWFRGALEGRRGFLRGAAVTYTTITLILFPLLLSGTYRNLDGQLMHLAVPILAIADWLVVGRNQGRVAWFVPLLWLVVPLGYLPFYIARSNEVGALYKFLDPSEPGFVRWVVVLLVAFLIAGYLVWGVGRLRAALLGPEPQILGPGEPDGFVVFAQPVDASPGSSRPSIEPTPSPPADRR